MKSEFASLVQLFEAIPDEVTAIRYFAAICWKDGPSCPYPKCGKDKIYSSKDGKSWKCAACRKRFSVRVGTIFEDSKIPMRVWMAAIWMITNHPKGIASTTLATDLGITQKSAWFVLHRLRHAARTRSFYRPLRGRVEIDETYVGGKSTNRHGRRSGFGGGHKNKTPVIGAVEREGVTIARVLPNASPKNMHEFVRKTVAEDAELLSTDAHPAYQSLTGFERHQIVNHHLGEYRKGDAHTNSIESVWALLKRQIFGIHHWVSRKHLQKYVDEMSWRYNQRQLGGSPRMAEFLGITEGRLTYKTLIAKV